MSASPAKPAPAAKVVKKKAAVAAGPKYIDLIKGAIVGLAGKKGSSRAAIVAYVQANNKVGENARLYINQALKRGVAKGILAPGALAGKTGAGCFKVVKQAAPKKKVVKKEIGRAHV